MNNLKNYRENELKWYVISYLIWTVAVCNLDVLKNVDIDFVVKLEGLFASALLSGVISVLAFVFDSLYSTEAKDGLLYLGFTKAPGSTIFSEIRESRMKDSRIDISKAQSRYKEIIENIPESNEKYQYENTTWYSIYSKYQTDGRVMSVHRDFLLCRDLYITTVSLIVLTLIVMAVSLLPFNWLVIGYLLVMWLLTNVAAHNKARRFVYTVIAADLAADKKQELVGCK